METELNPDQKKIIEDLNTIRLVQIKWNDKKKDSRIIYTNLVIPSPTNNKINYTFLFHIKCISVTRNYLTEDNNKVIPIKSAMLQFNEKTKPTIKNINHFINCFGTESTDSLTELRQIIRKIMVGSI